MNFRNSILLTALSLLGFEIIAQNHGNYDSTYAPSKGIYGNASKKDLIDLKEEGIDAQMIPWVEDKDN